MTARTATVKRTTNETSVEATIDLDEGAEVSAQTGVGFFDHMIEQLGRHSGFGLRLKATGDLQVDSHHTVEDCGIVLGEAFKEALGEKLGIGRYGWSIVPMEEALCRAALDISGRPFLSFDVKVPAEAIGNYDPDLTQEFFVAFTRAAGLTLHLQLLAGQNSHHIVESVFKAVAQALKAAARPDGSASVPSTKGVL